MMKTTWFIYFFLVSSMVYAFENEYVRISEQAAAFFEARDYSKANELYDLLLAKDMPDWERYRAIYNKGVIQLAQNQFRDSFSLFQSIPVDKITTLSFIEKLMLNQAMNYFQSSLAGNLNEEERAVILLDAFQFLTVAIHISCENQKAAELIDEKCLVPSEFGFLSRQITIDRVEFLLKQLNLSLQSMNSPLLFIQIGVERWMDFIRSINMKSIPTEFQKNYRSLIVQEGESLLPLWKTWQEGLEDEKQKKLAETMVSSYLSIIDLVKKSYWKEGLDRLESLNTQLNEWLKTLDSPAEIGRLLVEYIRILNNDILEKSDLEYILGELEHVSNQNELIKKSIENLKIAIQNSDAREELKTKLFVWASFYDLRESIENVMSEEPISLLQLALDYAKQTRWLVLLAQLKNAMVDDEQIHALLVNRQNKTVALADHFIEEVIVQQNARFRGVDVSWNGSRCQKYPWEQVIPLFENGYRSAQLAKKELAKQSPRLYAGLANQYFTIKYWTQALDLLRQFLKNSGSSENKPDSLQQEENMQQLFRDLQKMESDDAPNRRPAFKERHTW